MKKVIFTVCYLVVFHQNILCSMSGANFYNSELSVELRKQLYKLHAKRNQIIKEAIEVEKDMNSRNIHADFHNFYIRRLSDTLKNIDEILHALFGINPHDDENLIKEAKRILNYT